jgi:hypothetical protein
MEAYLKASKAGGHNLSKEEAAEKMKDIIAG